MTYRQIFKEEITKKVSNTDYCPRKSNLVRGFFRVEDNILTIDASGVINDPSPEDAGEDQTIILKNIPFENDINYKDGCYRVEPNNGIGCDTDYYMGIDYKIGNDTYNICHKEAVQTYFSSLFDDPNTLTRFFKLLFAAIIILIITTIFGCCYEFWLRYGDSIDCLYYFSKECKNISEELDGKVSLLDYMFPKSICVYPYQKSMKFSSNSKGGSNKKNIMKGGEDKTTGFKSNSLEYKEANGDKAKCITLEDVYESHKRPFPYSMADFVHENNSSSIIKTPIKFFSFTFLYSVLFTRWILNKVLLKCSSGYKRTITSATASNIVFLLLCGLLLPYSPFAILGLVISFISAFIPIVGFFSLIFCLHPKLIIPKILNTDNCKTVDNQTDFLDYYSVININPLDDKCKFWYPFKQENKEVGGASRIPDVRKNIGIAMKIAKLIYTILANIYMIFLLFFILMFGFLGLALGNTFASIYMTFSVLFNFFYIPITNPLEFFDIMKDHGDLLTILFCIGVISSASFAFNKNTIGIMSAILVIIILYKLSKGFKAK